MNSKEFEELISPIFHRVGADGRNSRSPTLINFCVYLFERTWAEGQSKLVPFSLIARYLYGGREASHRQAAKQTIKRARRRLSEHYAKHGVPADRPKVEIVTNRDEAQIVRDPETGNATAGYGIRLRSPSGRRRRRRSEDGDRLHLGLYAGRDSEVDAFERMLADLDRPRRDGHFFSFYGFGGIGKSTLLKVLRDVADKRGLKVHPPYRRDQVIGESTKAWLARRFMIDAPESPSSSEERWREVVATIEPGCVVFVDSIAEVDMREFNICMSSLALLLRQEEATPLFVTATRREPHFSLNPRELTGLSVADIKLLSRSEDWPSDIHKHATELRERTDGNPFVLGAICNNPDLWHRFKKAKLEVSGNITDVEHLIKEMFTGLSEEARTGLTVTAAIAHYAGVWGFEWGRDECRAVFGGAWEDIALELKGACFIRDDVSGGYEMHELVADFGFRRLKSSGEVFETLGDHFSRQGNSMLATLFYTEATR